MADTPAPPAPTAAAPAPAPAAAPAAPTPTPTPTPTPPSTPPADEAHAARYPTATGTGVPAPTSPAPTADGSSALGWLIVLGFIALLVFVGVRAARRKRAQLAEPEALPAKREKVEEELEREALAAKEGREEAGEAREEAEEEREEAEGLPEEEERARDRAGAEVAEAKARAEAAEAARREEEQARKKAEYDARKAAERARKLEEEALGPEQRAALEAERDRAEAEAIAALERAEEERRRARGEEEDRKKAEYRARKEADRADRERKKREAEEAEAARLRAIEEERQRKEEEQRREAEERRRRVEAEAGKTLLEGLTKTREGGFVARLAGLFGGDKVEISEKTIAELEEILFTADIGVKTSLTLVEHARDRLKNRELSNPDKLRATIRSDIEEILARAQDAGGRKPLAHLGLPVDAARRPWVIMVVGVNGAGKTTTIGKLAAKLKGLGKSVVLGAGDTFRAAATEQLDVWAERAGVPIVKGPDGSDPGAVLFDAVKKAVVEGLDVVIADTAGRLHTKAPLMEELKRVKKVMSKAREGAPDEVLLVLDATNGQNAIQQARQFHDALGVTGIVLTKLDGTAKGGVVIGISDELKIPVRLVGIGESLADLRPFEPKEFVSALFG